MSVMTKPLIRAAAPVLVTLERVVHVIRQRRARCQNSFYAPFLGRRVRCRLDAGHQDRHQFVFLDETVTWR